MLGGGGSRRRRATTAMAVTAAVAIGALAGGCGSDPDASPTVASVDFDPRVVVTVDDTGVTARPGDRSGATEGGPGGAAWMVRTGSVVELSMRGGAAQEVVVTVTPLAEVDDPAAERPWVDVGTMQPGESTVLGLSAEGLYRVTATAGGTTSDVALAVVPR